MSLSSIKADSFLFSNQKVIDRVKDASALQRAIRNQDNHQQPPISYSHSLISCPNLIVRTARTFKHSTASILTLHLHLLRIRISRIVVAYYFIVASALLICFKTEATKILLSQPRVRDTSVILAHRMISSITWRR